MNKLKYVKISSISFLCITTLVTIILSISQYTLNASIENGRHFHLNGRVIFIDPGHGGRDNGTSYENILEDEINLIVATKLYEKLIDYGAITYISRNGDYDLASLYARNRKDEDMRKRINYINSISPDLFVSIHLNYYPNPNVSGAQVFYKKSNEKGELLAKCLQDSLNDLNSRKKKTKIGDYYLTNNSIYPGVIIECGFVSNYQDRKKLTTSEYQSLLVSKIIDGITAFFKLS